MTWRIRASHPSLLPPPPPVQGERKTFAHLPSLLRARGAAPSMLFSSLRSSGWYGVVMLTLRRTAKEELLNESNRKDSSTRHMSTDEWCFMVTRDTVQSLSVSLSSIRSQPPVDYQQTHLAPSRIFLLANGGREVSFYVESNAAGLRQLEKQRRAAVQGGQTGGSCVLVCLTVRPGWYTPLAQLTG